MAAVRETRSTALLGHRSGVPGGDQGHARRTCASAPLPQVSPACRANNRPASAAACGTPSTHKAPPALLRYESLERLASSAKRLIEGNPSYDACKSFFTG